MKIGRRGDELPLAVEAVTAGGASRELAGQNGIFAQQREQRPLRRRVEDRPELVPLAAGLPGRPAAGGGAEGGRRALEAAAKVAVGAASACRRKARSSEWQVATTTS